MLLQFLSWLYSFLPICQSLLHRLFSCFTVSLPNLTVRVLIRRSVSQAVLSFCLNIHLLSVYLHLRKNPPRLACAATPLPLCLFYLTMCLALSFSILSIVLCFVLKACLTSLFPQLRDPWLDIQSFPLLVTDGPKNVSYPVACCNLAVSLLHWLFHTYSEHTQWSRGGEVGG